MAFLKTLGLLFSLLLSTNILADSIKINPNHPDQYTVVKGDTLWDISGKFLENPWQWPEVWGNNPQ
ncbi:MAG: LysM peptidoglycan-binding domain-containing protein, partial [Methylomarinum sp.]|nr:LysM peptidoglycan-binding domain-containing protein [Methylomarinum sp.]